MWRHKLLLVLAFSLVSALTCSHPAHAYLDPGTTGTAISMLAPVITIILAFLGLALWPFRKFFALTIKKLRKNKKDGNEEPQN